jgi:hypothetical protein
MTPPSSARASALRVLSIRAACYVVGILGGVPKCTGAVTMWPLKSPGPELGRANFRRSGAGEGIRTPDPNLGKVVLYP